MKDAFRKLCMEYHPDRCKPELKPVAGARFREIKSAYDVLLKMQAGYSPPPPGAAPSEAYQKAYDEYQRRARSSYGASASGD